MNTMINGLIANWHIWTVSIVLVVAAVIDGWKLKVPNWITFPMILTGWIYSFASGGWSGLGWSLLATFFGLALLYGIYMVGGMGAGDVKLLAGIGAWVHANTLGTFLLQQRLSAESWLCAWSHIQVPGVNITLSSECSSASSSKFVTPKRYSNELPNESLECFCSLRYSNDRCSTRILCL